MVLGLQLEIFGNPMRASPLVETFEWNELLYSFCEFYCGVGVRFSNRESPRKCRFVAQKIRAAGEEFVSNESTLPRTFSGLKYTHSQRMTDLDHVSSTYSVGYYNPADHPSQTFRGALQAHWGIHTKRICVRANAQSRFSNFGQNWSLRQTFMQLVPNRIQWCSGRVWEWQARGRGIESTTGPDF